MRQGKSSKATGVSSLPPMHRQTTHAKRAMLAEFCRVWGGRVDGRVDGRAPQSATATDQPPQTGESPLPAMAPRLAQTLDRLLAGDSEKQIAAKLGLSPHTIHDYVKGVYRRFGVCSRAELLALWVKK